MRVNYEVGPNSTISGLLSGSVLASVSMRMRNGWSTDGDLND